MQWCDFLKQNKTAKNTQYTVAKYVESLVNYLKKNSGWQSLFYDYLTF